MKYLKKLLILTITFSLLNIHYQPGQMGFHISSSDLQAKEDQTEAKGVYSGEKAKDADGYMSYILYLAIGFITARMIKGSLGKMPYDVVLGSVGGAAMLLGELFLLTQNKKSIEERTIGDKEKGLNNQQIESLRTQRDLNKDLKYTLETKLTIQKAIYSTFLASSIVTIFMMAAETKAEAQLLALSSANSTVSPQGQITAQAVVELMSNNSLPKSSIEDRFIMNKAFLKMRSDPAAIEVIQLKESNAFFDAGTLLNSPFASIFKTIQDKAPPFIKSPVKKALQFIAYSLINLIIPPAKAKNWGRALGTGLGVLTAVYLPQAVYFDKYLATPHRRFFAWTAMGLIVKLVSNKTEEQLKAVTNNISKLDEILSNPKLRGPEELDIDNNPPLNGDQLFGSKTIPFRRVTLNGAGQKVEESIKAPCTAGTDKNGRCLSVLQKIRPISSLNGFNLKSALVNTGGPILALGDKISGASKLSKSTLNNISQIASKKNALLKNKKRALSKLNNILTKSGQKPFEQKRITDFNNNIRGKLRASLLKEGLSPKIAASKLGLSTARGQSTAKANFKPRFQNQKETFKSERVLSKTRPAGLNFGFVQEKTRESGHHNQVHLKDENAKKIAESFIKDISDKKETSLFKIISVRYLKSAYKKLQN